MQKSREEILKQDYMSCKDLKMLIPDLGINAIHNFMNEVKQQMIEEGYYIIPSRKLLVATKLVRKKLKI